MSFARCPAALVYCCIAASLTPVPSWAQQRVACVGDSITAGYNLAPSEAYPVVLQGLLNAAEFEVQNFGLSGATVLKDGNLPYWSSSQYQDSSAFEPDWVVLILGTNDAKAANWAHQAQFDANYRELVEHYRELGAQVLVGVPPPVFEPGAFEISPQILGQEVSVRVRGLATELDAPVFDLFDAFEGQAELFPDTVHPNAQGAAQLAQQVYSALLLAAQPSREQDSGAGAGAGAGGAAPLPSAVNSAGSGGQPAPPGTPSGAPGANPTASASASAAGGSGTGGSSTAPSSTAAPSIPALDSTSPSSSTAPSAAAPSAAATSTAATSNSSASGAPAGSTPAFSPAPSSAPAGSAAPPSASTGSPNASGCQCSTPGTRTPTGALLFGAGLLAASVALRRRRAS